jgi:hypothetical protein
MTVTLVILAAIALALLAYRTAHGSGIKVGNVEDLPSFTESIDFPAFLNLTDPTEEEFLRANLSPHVFRRVQRLRLRASAEYVRCAARNAAVLVRLGEAVGSEESREISRIGQELLMAAIRLRALAFLALCVLHLQIAIPNVSLSITRVPKVYGSTIERVGQLARLKRPAQVSRILQSL